MNSIKKIQDADLKNKKVLVRVDFNVAVENGKARNKFKLSACKETVDYILSQGGAKVALLSHLGRPSFEDTAVVAEGKDGKAVKKISAKYSLEQLKGDVESALGRKIIFVPDCVGEEVKKAMDNSPAGSIFLLENVRLYQEDEINDEGFARKLAENFDAFVNEAFGVCHRDQASVIGIAKIIPACAGIWLQREIENLSKVKESPDRPAVAIMGGAKIETKLPLIYMFESNYDCVLVGGKIANEAVDKSVNFSTKVFLPLDYAEGRLDIGEKTVEQFKKIIKQAKTIVWNGPMGKFEEPPFDKGTKEVLSAIIGSGAFSVAGGGESVQVLEENGDLDKVSFVSTGGGAMLEFLCGNPMPGIEVLMV